MGGKRVPEGVGRYFLVDSGKDGLSLDNIEHRDTAQRLAKAAQEEDVIIFGHRRRRPLPKVVPHRIDSRFSDRHESLLVTFSYHSDKAFVQEETGDSEADGFRDTQAAAIEDFQDSPVPSALPGSQVDRIQDRFHFSDGKD